MNKIIPQKLKHGDVVRIITPSGSLASKTPEEVQVAQKQFEELGLKVTYGKSIYESDMLTSSSTNSRLQDLHEAFADKNIKAIICAKGGFNANQLLDQIDYELIKNNPKIICGYSDITALNVAIYAKTGLVTYMSPTFSSFTHGTIDPYTLSYFKKALFTNDEYEVTPSESYKDWTNIDENGVEMEIKNEGYWIINEGEANGTLIAENLCTLNLLQGTEYFPDITNAILFIEDDYESKEGNFLRDLQSLLQQQNAHTIQGLVIGRFQKASNIDKEKLIYMLSTFPQLKKIPIIANIDFGHTEPRITMPVGANAKISGRNNKIHIGIQNR